MLWMGEGRRRVETAALAGVSLPTVDRWVDRYEQGGVDCAPKLRLQRCSRELNDVCDLTTAESSRVPCQLRELGSGVMGVHVLDNRVDAGEGDHVPGCVTQ